jgi:hypothetical protein
MGKVLLIVGAVLLVLSMCGLGIAILIPLTGGGRTNWSEAMVGIVPGVLCSALSLILTVVGLILVLTNRGQSDPRSR